MGLNTFAFYIATLGLLIKVCDLCVHLKVQVCPNMMKYNHVFAQGIIEFAYLYP